MVQAGPSLQRLLSGFLMPGTDERSRWEGILERNVLLWWRPQSHRTPPSFGNLKEDTPWEILSSGRKAFRKSPQVFFSPVPTSPFPSTCWRFPGPELNSLSPSPPQARLSQCPLLPTGERSSLPIWLHKVECTAPAPDQGGRSRLKSSSLSAHSHQAEQPGQQAFS